MAGSPGQARKALSAARDDLARGDPAAARAALVSLTASRENDVEALTLLSRAELELGHRDAALEAATTLDEIEGADDLARLLTAEVLVTADETEAALERLDAMDRDNVVAAGLVAVLEAPLAGRPPRGRSTSSDASAAEDRDTVQASLTLDFNPAWLWFESVGAVLLLQVERALEDSRDDPATVYARSHLVQPDLRPELFQSPEAGAWTRLIERLQGEEVRRRRQRERSVSRHFWDRDLEAARDALASWLEEEPHAYGRTGNGSGTERGNTGDDPRSLLLKEVLFALGEHSELLRRFGKPTGPLADLQVAFARYTAGQHKAARTAIAAAKMGDAAEAHLHGLLDLADGRAHAALAWFRRAFARDDIATVALLRAELQTLGVELRNEKGTAKS